jgi:hypothetical protein
MNTFPKFTEFLPNSNLQAINANMSYLSARKKPTMVRGYDCVERKLQVENNLLVR